MVISLEGLDRVLGFRVPGLLFQLLSRGLGFVSVVVEGFKDKRFEGYVGCWGLYINLPCRCHYLGALVAVLLTTLQVPAPKDPQ